MPPIYAIVPQPPAPPPPPPAPIPLRYLVSVDLGQQNDYTAITILETSPRRPNYPEPAYQLRHLERLSLGTSYPAVAAHVRALLARRPLQLWPTYLVIDSTGVGRAIVDMLRPHFRALIPVTITAGRETNADGEGGFNVPKRDLIGVVQMLLQSRRLKFAAGLPGVDVLVRELETFRAKISISTGHESFEAWRERDHDDCVLSLAIGCWVGELIAAEEKAAADADAMQTTVFYTK
jgi:hypothetical protein